MTTSFLIIGQSNMPGYYWTQRQSKWKQRKHQARTHAQQCKTQRGRGLGIALSNSKPQLRDNDAGYNAMYALLARSPIPNCTKSKVDRRGNPK